MGGRGNEGGGGGGFLGLGFRVADEERRGVLEGEGLEDEEEEEEEEERVRQERRRGEERGEPDEERGGVVEVRDGDRERPPAYEEALRFPVLIVHGDESCHGSRDIDTG